jgi:hypothetical protein
MAAGKKTGGRKKGSLNKTTGKIKADKIAIAASGLTPLEYMLQVLRNPDSGKDRRDRIAAQAAPYVHPRLTSIGGTPNEPIEMVIKWADEK